MSSVSSSLNPGVADLLQTLTNVNSPVLNSKSVVSALEKAPPSDIVQLSAEATQLQSVDALFGISTSSSSSTSGALFGIPTTSTSSNSSVSNADTLFGIPTTSTSASTSSSDSVLQALENAGATVSPTDQAANDQVVNQAILAQGLFGTGTNNSLGTLLNTLG
jgi:hypothetical protein